MISTDYYTRNRDISRIISARKRCTWIHDLQWSSMVIISMCVWVWAWVGWWEAVKVFKWSISLVDQTTLSNHFPKAYTHTHKGQREKQTVTHILIQGEASKQDVRILHTHALLSAALICGLASNIPAVLFTVGLPGTLNTSLLKV